MKKLWLLLSIIFISYKRIVSLQKLCFNKEKKFLVDVFRKLEKNGAKVLKLILDVKFLESCLELKICPEFLKFKRPRLSVYNNSDNLFQSVLNKKLLETKQELRQAERLYSSSKEVFRKLTFLERNCLISLLSDYYKELAKKVIKRHHFKLLNIWKKQRHSSPDCLKNFSSTEFSIKQQEALRFGLGNHILPPKVRPDNIKTNIERLVYSLKKNTTVLPDQESKDQVK